MTTRAFSQSSCFKSAESSNYYTIAGPTVHKTMALFFAIIVLGSISLCLADKSDGGAQVRGAAAALTSAQKHNEMLINNHAQSPAAAQPSQPLLGNNKQSASNAKTPCTCGVFLSSQISKGGSSKQPAGYAALMYEQDEPATCNALGVKTCTNKCLEIIAKHLPNSAAIICGSVNRDVYKERAHLFVKNCNDSWTNTLLSTGKEYCCKDGLNYKCPLQ